MLRASVKDGQEKEKLCSTVKRLAGDPGIRRNFGQLLNGSFAGPLAAETSFALLNGSGCSCKHQRRPGERETLVNC